MDHYLSGDITVKTRWKEYSKKVRNDQRYLDLIPAFGYDTYDEYCYQVKYTNRSELLQIHPGGIILRFY